jgi:hypothetical protein
MLVVEVNDMIAGPGILSPAVSEGGGSWVLAVVAVGIVAGALAIAWIARLWGRPASDLPAHDESTDRGEARIAA